MLRGRGSKNINSNDVMHSAYMARVIIIDKEFRFTLIRLPRPDSGSVSSLLQEEAKEAASRDGTCFGMRCWE